MSEKLRTLERELSEQHELKAEFERLGCKWHAFQAAQNIRELRWKMDDEELLLRFYEHTRTALFSRLTNTNWAEAQYLNQSASGRSNDRHPLWTCPHCNETENWATDTQCIECEYERPDSVRHTNVLEDPADIISARRRALNLRPRPKKPKRLPASAAQINTALRAAFEPVTSVFVSERGLENLVIGEAIPFELPMNAGFFSEPSTLDRLLDEWWAPVGLTEED